MVTVLNYVGELIQICSAQQITRQEARITTLAQLAESTLSIAGQRLNSFCEALSKVYNQIQRWECCDRNKLNTMFGHLQFDETIPLVYLLPQPRDEGLLIHVLYNGSADPMRDDNWKSIGLAQNPVAQELINKCGSPSRSAVHRPYALTHEDLLTFDSTILLCDELLSLYVNPLPVVEFTKDLANLQWQVVRDGSVWGKPLLASTLPDFSYIEDQKSSVFGSLAAVVDRYGGSLPLRKDLLKRLLDIIEHHRNCREHLISYLSILAAEFICRPPYQVPYYLHDLAELIPVDLTEAQQAGKELLSSHVFTSVLQPQHILSLVEPLWDGALCSKCCVPLDKDTITSVTTVFEEIVRNPQTMRYALPLKSAFRMLGLQKLCVEQPAGYYSSGFIDMLEAVEVSQDIPWDQLLRNSIVAEVPTQHFHAVYNIAETVLGSAALSIGDQDEADESNQTGTFEVKLDDLRSLLKFTSNKVVTVWKPKTSRIKSLSESVNIPGEMQTANKRSGAVVEHNSLETRDDDGSPLVYKWEGQGILIDFED